jgi:hypothetical protein
VLVAHLALGNGVAGLTQRRGGPASTITLIGGGEAVHGCNDAGLVCAVVEGDAHAVVRRVLDGATGVDSALRLLHETPVALGHPLRLLVGDAERVVNVALHPQGGIDVEPAEADGGDDGLSSAIAHLRAREPEPREGAAPAAGMVALLAPGEPPRLWLALGPPSCSVFVRFWPGMEVVPDASASPEGSLIARLAAAVAETTATDPELRAAARTRLDAAEAAALEEGEAAERMAARMDADTDDAGAMVRRLVAQAYAVDVARTALEELAVPAPPGSKPGPRL